MTDLNDPNLEDLVNRILEQTRARLPAEQAPPAERFVSRYFVHVPYEDIRNVSTDNLFGAVLAHWKLGATRPPGTAAVRVYNPRLEEHGWRCDHTVVEVVNDDMPFLVDSVSAELNRRGLAVHLVVHPIVPVSRDDEGHALDVPDADGEAVAAESFMHFEVTEQSAEKLEDIRAGVETVLTDVRAAVEDWQAMRTRLSEIIDEISSSRQRAAADDVDEVVAFLKWMHDNHYTFLGYRDYVVEGRGDKASLSVVADSGLGLLRNPEVVIFRELRKLEAMPPSVRAFVQRPDLLLVTKTNRLSTVHRPVHMDSIGIKRFDSRGRVAGLRTFVGLFTAAAYNRSPREIPLLRRKIDNALARSGFLRNTHNGRAFLNILDTYPRDELFQVSEDHLLQTGLGILHLQERQRLALFLRRDEFERFISCLVYVPRDQYTTELRMVIQDILMDAFGGEVMSHHAVLGDAAHARLHLIVQTTPGAIPEYDAHDIEARLEAAARSWHDHLHDALITAFGEDRGLRLAERYQRAFRSSYREQFSADMAVADIEKVDRVLETGALAMSLYRPIGTPDNELRFKLYHPSQAIPLSDVLPMLEHMGLKVMDEEPHRVRPTGTDIRRVMIHDFGLATRDSRSVDLGAVREDFQDAFQRVWRQEVESDGFNALVLRAGLDWREVVILRAYCKFLRQAGTAFSQAYMEETLASNPGLTRLIVELFRARLDPHAAKGANRRVVAIQQEIADGLDAVESADEDRILRRFVNLVDCTLRTNAFQAGEGGEFKPCLSFKLDSAHIDELPLPRPMVEVFVYSPRIEGIHLRFGRVARGGLRWSDRREDFRTEILGLVKAQQVKNTVIVPVGSKGGFVVKRPPAGGDREALLEEGIACYKMFIGGLLDLTDNLKGGTVLNPPDVVRRDEDDPYLVVAADKGTTTFSDIANEVSEHYQFWLGDAFASGGSHGYDHKKMGITARGAWESVKRHFREMGRDCQSQDFTVIGVGDMAGDVFGNGMLLSPHIKLIGAFNHMHIFVDPDPDPASSFAERKRLFELPRSAWTDYDPTLISEGGGVFSRTAKSLTLSPQVRRLVGLRAERVTPNELIRALLKAETDLLWFGGIGTFVKAGDESHAEAGDRANDALRVNAGDLRCKVVGEGANLGLTQRARVEYALGGGRLNTDFIDNSAGVDCSDHEVNIKILLDAVVANGDMTVKQRNALLVRMTDEVGELVLQDNYRQTQAITLAEADGVEGLDDQIRLMRLLEREAGLDRAVEFLPDDEALAERAAARRGLTRPELSVVLSYAKIWLYDKVLDSDLPDDPYLAEDVVRYFPTPLRRKFKAGIARHRLRRELVATSITNSLINRVGATFVTEIAERTGMGAADIARAYIVTRDVFALRDVWQEVEALDNRVASAMQTTLLTAANQLIERGTLWFLYNGTMPLDIGETVAGFAPAAATLAPRIGDVLPEAADSRIRHRAGRYMAEGVPEDLALRVAYQIVLVSACDILRLSRARNLDLEDVARLYFTVGETFGFGWLRYQAERLGADSHWQKLAVASVIEELYGHQRDVTLRVLEICDGAIGDQTIETWSQSQGVAVERVRQLLGELEGATAVDLPMVIVASRQLGGLAQSATGT